MISKRKDRKGTMDISFVVGTNTATLILRK